MMTALCSTRIIVATKRSSLMRILTRRLFSTGHSLNVRCELKEQQAVCLLTSRTNTSAHVLATARLAPLLLHRARSLRTVRRWCSDFVNLRRCTAIHQWSAQSIGVATALSLSESNSGKAGLVAFTTGSLTTLSQAARGQSNDWLHENVRQTRVCRPPRSDARHFARVSSSDSCSPVRRRPDLRVRA